MEFIVRKAGHLTLYFILTAAFFFLIQASAQPLGLAGRRRAAGRGHSRGGRILTEFVSGRSGSVLDVFIDWCGIGAALFLSSAPY